MQYSVKINGKQADILSADVSAYPLNRVWPGKQRPHEQTKPGYFVLYRFESHAHIEIHTDFSINDISIRPSYVSAQVSFEEHSITVQLTDAVHISVEINKNKENICFLPHTSDCTCEATDNTVIYFGKGEHYPGIISPKSGQTVWIDEGAVVHGGIFIHKEKNVRIIGHGILDAGCLKRGIEATPGAPGSAFADGIRQMGLSQRDVEYSGALVAYACENLHIEGISILNSMFWTMILRNGCKNVEIDNVKIFGQWRYNSDGINICASSDVTVKNCFIRSFDDCIVVRGPFLDHESGNMRNIEVRNCVLWCDWGINMEIFCADRPTVIEDVRFINNYVIRVSTTVADIQTWWGSAHSVVRNVLYENIWVDSIANTLALQYQSADDTVYVFDGRPLTPKFLALKCGKLGKNLGNQQFEPAQDLSQFHVSYEHITLRGIQMREMLENEISNPNGIIHIQDVRLEDCVFG